MSDTGSTEPEPGGGNLEQPGQIVLPLLEESIDVSRRKIDTGVVQVATVTRTSNVLVEEELNHERVEIERIAIGRIVDSAPPVREEGDTTIIPVVEEVLIVEKRLILKEEIHLRRVSVKETHRETVTLRQQEAVVSRKASNPGPDGRKT
jgi:uncharacterized protein (TIGR02271 family)